MSMHVIKNDTIINTEHPPLRIVGTKINLFMLFPPIKIIYHFFKPWLMMLSCEISTKNDRMFCFFDLKYNIDLFCLFQSNILFGLALILFSRNIKVYDKAK